MRVIILAAGRGSRLKERTKVLPKCLTELWGKRLIDWQLRAIRAAGISQIAIVTGYHAEEIKKRVEGVTFFHNAKWEETNMVSTLLCAKDWLHTEPCIVSYADVVYSQVAIRILCDMRANIGLVYQTNFWELWQERFANPLDDLETFRLTPEGNLAEIGKRPTSEEEIEGQYMGLLRFSPTGWQNLEENLHRDLPRPLAKMDMTALLEHLILQGVRIQAKPYAGLWVEVDNNDDLAAYKRWDKTRYQELLA